jgi:hypothetical protein
MEEGKRRTSPGVLGGDKKHAGGGVGSSGGGTGGMQQHQGRGSHVAGKQQFRGRDRQGGGWTGQQNVERRGRQFPETEYPSYDSSWQEQTMDGESAKLDVPT